MMGVIEMCLCCFSLTIYWKCPLSWCERWWNLGKCLDQDENSLTSAGTTTTSSAIQKTWKQENQEKRENLLRLRWKSNENKFISSHQSLTPKNLSLFSSSLPFIWSLLREKKMQKYHQDSFWFFLTSSTLVLLFSFLFLFCFIEFRFCKFFQRITVLLDFFVKTDFLFTVHSPVSVQSRDHLRQSLDSLTQIHLTFVIVWDSMQEDSLSSSLSWLALLTLEHFVISGYRRFWKKLCARKSLLFFREWKHVGWRFLCCCFWIRMSLDCDEGVTMLMMTIISTPYAID